MTEIPEHLLKRSQAAKAKATGGEAPADAPATSAPAAAAAESTAVTPAAAPAAPAKPAAPVGPPPPKPDTPVVAAGKARKKIPFWAMATLSLLPLWAFMYLRGLTPKEPTVHGPLGEGAEVYSGCASCHGVNGEGGLGYQFSNGEVLKTFPNIEDQLRFVYNGTLKYELAGVESYGDPNREGGPHITQGRGIMPPQSLETGGGLTEAQILAVVCHERYTLGGADLEGDFAEEYEQWCSPEAPAWEGLESGELTFTNIADELELPIPVGTEPAAGSSAP